MQARRVRKADHRSPSGHSTSLFFFSTVAVQYNPFFYDKADPQADLAKLYETAIANGQVFTPNGGRTWFVVVHLKTPFHSTY